MDAVIDTVALVHHLNDSLPPRAEKVFRQAEGGTGRLWLPEVALGEFAYLVLKGRIRVPHPRAIVEEVLAVARGAGYLRTCALESLGWETFLDLPIPELHDRMIAAIAVSRGLPLVSNDPVFGAVSSLEIVW